MLTPHFCSKILVACLLALCCFSCEKSTQQTTDPVDDEVTTQKLDKPATMLSLAWVSYINSGMKASRDSLQDHATHGVPVILADQNVTSEIGTWKSVWGPVTYTQSEICTSCRTDNTMMLLKGKDPKEPSKDMYVVAIAGTNFTSLFDWGDEDFLSTTLAKWPDLPTQGSSNLAYFSSPESSIEPSVTNSGNFISFGISSGLDILFNRMSYEGKTLAEYLKQEFQSQQNPIELAVTGHSLGGALSPCVALALKDNQSYWDPNQKATVTTYPFAGQSPGNDKFAAYFSSRIKSEDFHGHYNSYDVVPKGFQESDLNQVQDIYTTISPELAKQCVIGKIIHCVKQNIDPFNYTSLYSKENQFTYQVDYSDSTYKKAYNGFKDPDGKVCGGLIYLDCVDEFKTGYTCREVFARTENFGNMVSIQHLNGYIDAFKIQNIVSVITAHQIESPPSSFFSLYCNTPLFYNCPGTDLLCQ